MDDPDKTPTGLTARIARIARIARVLAGHNAPAQPVTLFGELAGRLADTAARKRTTAELLLRDIVKQYLNRAQRKK
jgi:hypothetical protein